MDRKDFIAMVLIIFLSLWGTLYLETNLTSYYVLELFVILLLIIVSVGILYALVAEKKWVWHVAAVFFLFTMINSILLYIGTGSTIPFAVTFLSNLAGLALALPKAANMRSITKKPNPCLHPAANAYEEKNKILDAFETYNLDIDALLGKPKKKARKKKAKTKRKKR